MYMLCINYILIDLQVTNIGTLHWRQRGEKKWLSQDLGSPLWREPNQGRSYMFESSLCHHAAGSIVSQEAGPEGKLFSKCDELA